MTDFVAFLRAERSSIIELFTARVRASFRVAGLTQSELVNHLPDFLDEVIEALQAGTHGGREAPVQGGTGVEHGQQRLRVGYDLEALVREYGILRDCVLERLDHADLRPSWTELRVFFDCISLATADAVRSFMRDHASDREAERLHLLSLFEQAPGFVCFLRGPSLVFELANSAYFQLVGHREILGKPVREALPEVAGQGYFELLERVFASGEPFVGHAMELNVQRTMQGPMERAFLDFVYQPIVGAEGQPMGILVQGHDVTEVKQLEAERRATAAALRASEERYRTLFASIDDGYCLLEVLFDDAGTPVDYRFVETNSAFERQTGLQQAVGKTARELVPELDSFWFERYGRVATTGEPARFESHAPAMDRWFDVYANRVGDPALRQVALVFKDVTERRRIERDREELLARESAARKQAEEAGRMRDEFLATVSHELRTPLHAMLGWLQILRAGKLPPDRRERALETIERNARAQAQLIDDLLDVSRILAGKLKLELQAVDMQTVVEAALETVRPSAEAKQIALQSVLTDGAMVVGDAQRLQQVVWNLLANAVKFTPKGGRVQIMLEPSETFVEITVTDSGKGISGEFLPFVFERFRQQEGSTTRSHGGLGLGLSIVRHLVELHGGSVRVFSDGEGLGTTFSVRLPMALVKRRDPSSPTLQSSALPSGLPCPPELSGLDVLVVDDEEDAREMLRSMLEACGARVHVAASASEVLQLAEAQPPDALISDIGMPGEDGYSLIVKFRKLAPSFRRIPAIALTAYARTEDRTRAMLSGFSSHVPKPVEPLELLAVLASLAGRTDDE
jgi:PAS domain S-box-containing protein